MTKPFVVSDIFEIEDNLKIVKETLGPYEYYYIDNFYKRPNQINALLKESWCPQFIFNSKGRNFKDYYDCRLSFNIEDNGFVEDIKTQDFFYNHISKEYTTNRIDTNIFSWKKVPKRTIQHQPHTDGTLNILVYMDKINSGGTALYKERENARYLNLNNDNLQYDISDEKDDFYVIPSVFNRCIIFDGTIPHGGYIENHDLYTHDNWRYNCVYFLRSKDD